MTSEIDSPKSHHFKSLERMNNYPVVNDSLLLALSYYQWIKSKNKVLDSSLTMIENTLKTVNDKTEPLAEKLSIVNFIDNTMCNQLERLERICPVILEPSPTIQNIPKDIYNKSIQSSMVAASWPVSVAMDMFTKTTNATVSTMSSVVSSSMKIVIPASVTTTNLFFNKSKEIIDKIFPSEEEPKDESSPIIEQAGIYTNVKRISMKTQRRLYRMAVREINVLQKASFAKLTRLRGLIEEINSNTIPEIEKIVDTVEIANEPEKVVPSSLPNPKLIQEASYEIEQLQDIMVAVASVKKYATSNTLVSLHFINSNLSLLKTVLIVNQKVLSTSIKIIDKLQMLLEYVMSKIKIYVKYQKAKEARLGRKASISVFDDSDSN